MLLAQFVSATPNIIAWDAVTICALNCHKMARICTAQNFQRTLVNLKKEDGNLKHDNNGKIIFQTERRMLSCYHIAHHGTGKTTMRTSPLCWQCQRAPRRKFGGEQQARKELLRPCYIHLLYEKHVKFIQYLNHVSINVDLVLSFFSNFGQFLARFCPNETHLDNFLQNLKHNRPFS